MLELNRIYCGDCLETMKKIDDGTINSIITSPPYWQLRDNGWSGQWGLEPTFEEYLEHLWLFMTEAKRVLTDNGTVWINLGDVYHLQKNLMLIPHRFAIGCIEQGWILRNSIIWAKRNHLPESVKDRFSKKHEYIFFMVKKEKYYFDLDSVRDKCAPINRWGGTALKGNGNSRWDKASGQKTNRKRNMQPNGGMKNPGDVTDFWDIPTQSNKSSHYATYNFSLIDKPILAGCPKDGLILDPFAGSGTTLVRASQLGRNFIGIEGSEKYCKIAERNIEQELKLPKLF